MMKNRLEHLYGPPKRINDTTTSLKVMAGANITGAIEEGISVARGLDMTLQFDFNEVTVRVQANSNPEHIYRDWDRALNGYISKNVGPHPNPVLTDEEKASDARIEEKHERRRKKEQAAYEAKAKKHHERVETKLANAPGIELKDKAGWKKFKDVNKDGYGGAVVTFAERWARLMQVELASVTTPSVEMLDRVRVHSSGSRKQTYAAARHKILTDKFNKIADTTCGEADLEGISGFMYGCAVSTLSQCWKYGEELRQWHNLKTQIGNEGEKANKTGGVLNPALLSIG